MAEAFCRVLGRDVECSSAGSAPASHVQPDTIAAMSEVGIDISTARPRSFKDLPDRKYDYLVTMRELGTVTYFGAMSRRGIAELPTACGRQSAASDGCSVRNTSGPSAVYRPATPPI